MINKINNSNWREFDIAYNSKRKQGLFKVDVGGDIENVIDLLIPSDNQNDKVCIVSNTAINNGIIDEIEGYKTDKTNVITLATRGNDYKAFYHKDYYVIPVVRTICLTPVNFILNIRIAFFLSTIFYQSAYKYGYGRFLSGQRIKNDKIKLPAKQNSKNEYEPDWKFMEDYIKSLSKKVDFSDTIQFRNRALHPLNKQSFKEFRLSDIFIIERGKRLTKLNQISGEIAYISSTKENNGIDNYITPPEHMKIYKNALTLNNSGSVGYCFYHPYQFVISDHCTVLLLQDKKIFLNTNISLFLKTILEKIKYKYSFGREINNERLDKEFINLPATKNSKDRYEPNWHFMEDYIKSLPYSSNL